MAVQSNSIFGTLANQFSNSDSLFFDSQLSKETIHTACRALKHEFRERIYSPAITVWMFIGQVLSSDQSCRDAIARLNVWRVARGMRPVSTDSSNYFVRHLHYQVTQPGFRTRTIVIATTLLHAVSYTVEDIADLFRQRWQVELDIRSLKTHMQMEHLRCHSLLPPFLSPRQPPKATEQLGTIVLHFRERLH